MKLVRVQILYDDVDDSDVPIACSEVQGSASVVGDLIDVCTVVEQHGHDRRVTVIARQQQRTPVMHIVLHTTNH